MISGIILFLFLYIVGSIGQVVLGKKMINTLEHAFLQVPLVRNIYSASKQVVDAISLQRKAVFQSVVLIEFPRPGFKAIGFLTGHLDDTQGKKYCRVFIPTTPNPTTGFLEIIPSEEVVTTKLTVEEAFKMIISGGLVAPNLFFTVDEQGSKR
ncbi:MAG: DUF502 domain-containing protein [Sedimentisphaerales bacterium]|nr:DUF502 domain-containing protein [Sedimentisphaerales bacterium]